MKRFYTTVTVGEGGAILLDGRPVKTPAKNPLVLPGDALAGAVAEEWRGQGERIDPRAMPLTGLANAAIDRVMPDPAAFAAGIAKYGESELLCYRAEDPPGLIARQIERWDPILDWACKRYGVMLTTVSGIMHHPQPEETVARLQAAVAAYPPFVLAALSPIVTISGSLLIGLALADGALDPGRAFETAHLDELWQEEQWGADALAQKARAARRADFDAACRFLALLED